MNYNIELLMIDYIGGAFKKYIDFGDEIGKVRSAIDGDIEVGLATRDEGQEDIAMKLTIDADIINEKEDKVANMKTEYLFIFNIEERDIIIKLKNGDVSEDELKELISHMIDIGYVNIKEHMENTFMRANLKVSLPIRINI